ncbi:MAG TPA: hypothetical protein VN914_19540, partial [Polyangia bacterium]|nr:hypothetical protein [Polyangia bacterium]
MRILLAVMIGTLACASGSTVVHPDAVMEEQPVLDASVDAARSSDAPLDPAARDAGSEDPVARDSSVEDTAADARPADAAADAAAPPVRGLEALQRDFVDLRFGMFLHFGVLTYTGRWGVPNLDIRQF